MIWCVERLRGYLIGIPFEVVTDCQIILFLNGKKSINPQVARWFATLQEYDCSIEFRKSDRMSHVDGLSRGPVGTAEDTEGYIFERRCQVLTTSAHRPGHMAVIQWSDKRLRVIIELLWIPKRNLTKGEADRIKDYELVENRLYINTSVQTWVILESIGQ